MRKKGRVFLTFSFIILTFSNLSGDELQRKVVDLLGFPQIMGYYDIDLNAKLTRQINIGANASDLYRKAMDRRTVLTLGAQGYNCAVVWPIRIGKSVHQLGLEGEQKQYFFDNRRDVTTLISHARLLQSSTAIAWTAFQKGWYIGGGIRAGEQRVKNTFQVTSYPRSTDQLANQFFFDLLEPTFGREVDDSLVSHQKNYAFWLGFNILPRYRLAVGMATFDNRVNWDLGYVNTGRKAALAGPRRLSIPVNSEGRIIQVAIAPVAAVHQEIAIAVFQNRAELYIDNHPPAFIDFDSLGDMQLGRNGVLTRARWKHKNWRLQAGLSYCNYSGEVFLRTPVLGFQWGIIPIAHSATLRLSSGRSSSQLLACSYSYSWRRLSLAVGIDYYHVVYDFWIKGRADLEFGLTTRPLDYPYRYALHWCELSIQPEWRVGKWGISYGLRQIIPYGRRLDRSPIKLAVKREGVEYLRRGGSLHHIELRGYF